MNRDSEYVMPPESKLVIGLFFLLAWIGPAHSNGLCPAAAEDEHDGIIEDGNYKFTYESNVEVSKDESEFIRCIQNQSNTEIWTHWKGILSSGWIATSDRKLTVVSKTSGETDDKDKELWYGDLKDDHQIVETTCWDGEAACDTPDSSMRANQFRRVFMHKRPAPDVSDSEVIERALSRNVKLESYTYSEVFVPMDKDDARGSLVRIGVTITSVMDPSGELEYKAFLSTRMKELEYMWNYVNRYREPDNPLIALYFEGSVMAEVFPKGLGQYRKDLLAVLERGNAVAHERVRFSEFDGVSFETVKLWIETVRGDRLQMPVALYVPRY